MTDELREALDLAIRGFERIKTSDLTMDGFTTFHGRLSMDEVVAINEVFSFAFAHLGCSTITDQQVEAAARKEWAANLEMGRITVPDGWGDEQWLNYLAARTVYIKHQAEAAARVGTEKP